MDYVGGFGEWMLSFEGQERKTLGTKVSLPASGGHSLPPPALIARKTTSASFSCCKHLGEPPLGFAKALI